MKILFYLLRRKVSLKDDRLQTTLKFKFLFQLMLIRQNLRYVCLTFIAEDQEIGTYFGLFIIERYSILSFCI